MTTRAIQADFLLSGLIDPTTGVPLTGGTVEFYAAGTTTAKNVWTEKEKTNAYTSITLETGGIKQIYGDGIYKILVYDSDSTLKFTWDNIKIRASNSSVLTKIADYTTTTDDDVVLLDTTTGSITVTLHAASTWENFLILKNIGANTVVIDPNGTETIDGSSTFTMQGENEYIILFSDGSNIRSASGNTMTFSNTGLHILDTNASHDLIIKPGSNLTADRTFTLTTGDSDRTLTLSGNLTVESASLLNQDLTSDASPTFAGLTLSSPATVPNGGSGAATFTDNAVLTGNVTGAFNASALKVSDAGEMTNASQPCFNATGVSMSNLSNASAVTVQWTERIDQGADFASHTFTAPVTGKYLFTVSVAIQDMQIDASNYQITLITSNASYIYIIDPRGFDSVPTDYTIAFSVIADMDASDTAYVTYRQTGGTDTTTDLLTTSHFSGALIC